MNNGTLFSDYGYQALELCLDLDTSGLAPSTLQQLSALLCYFEREPDQMQSCFEWLEEQQRGGQNRLQALLSYIENLNLDETLLFKR
ncbi:hypothetical protein [Paenibacillus silvae]|uniref:Uncharacterized protein n=1 Tax=Paenibacillus silvae TaxID=1325358 RepID=A0A2W6NLA1_9BACL|nr:hypothetical protein [Paenibacillus silvae]PZT56594.1 hypothetical protein DN757_05990 [Paenibacillus silvae]